MDTISSQPVPDQRSVILLGETGAGKSSFGNFLLNRESFATGTGMLSTTQKIEQQSCQYTEDSLNIQLHVFDLPGLNDPRKIDTTHLKDTYSALKKCTKCMSTLFAIVINISIPEELESEANEILSFIEKVSLPDFDITENALLVFSNAHKLGSTREIQDSSFYRVIDSSPSLFMLLTIVRYRHILIESVCYASDKEYWLEKMREIITFTRPKVRVLLFGPHRTAQNDVLRLLRSKKSELGEVEEQPRCGEDELGEVSLEFEGMSLSFQKSVDFLTTGFVSESDSLERNNTLNQLTDLIQALIETHTFTAFCVLIPMETRIKSTFIEGIKSLANAISENKPDLFYNRCFFLFTHCNQDNTDKNCDLVFSNIPAMKQMRTDMGNRFFILNLQPQSATNDISYFLKQTVAFSHSMKQKCYCKDFVSNLLSKGFDLSATPSELISSFTSYLPSKQTLKFGGGGLIAIAGVAIIFRYSPAGARFISSVVTSTSTAGAVGDSIAAIPVIRISALASTLLDKLLKHSQKKKQEQEYEYDITTRRLEYIDT